MVPYYEPNILLPYHITLSIYRNILVIMVLDNCINDISTFYDLLLSVSRSPIVRFSISRCLFLGLPLSVSRSPVVRFSFFRCPFLILPLSVSRSSFLLL